MVDDSNYLTPHEAALAAVATCMKKARLQLDTLIINSILGGVLFSSGSVLYVAIHSENLDLLSNNPGILNLIGGLTYSVGLFYVVILGAELFNSNILYFSVGVLRKAATIYDLLISWFFSWLGNIAGSLFVSYLFIHVSGISTHEQWQYGASKVAEDKAAYSFMQTFLKAIAGNFFVCLAIYLQLMAKPIHVKFLMILLPIFTFVSSSYTHVVADMTTFFIAMLCGCKVTVGRYIWRVLIPASLGTMVGGAAFGLVIPFYLHLIVVERDRAKLSLPEYEARDEQPELNMDSRVIRVPVQKNMILTDSATTSGSDTDDMTIDEKENMLDDSTRNIINHNQSNLPGRLPLSASPSASASASLLSYNSTMSLHTTNSDINSLAPRRYSPPQNGNDASRMSEIQKIETIKEIISGKNSARSKDLNTVRSPPGVFPVAGMGSPLAKERTIENSNYPNDILKRIKTHSVADNNGYQMHNQEDDSKLLRRVKTVEADEENSYLNDRRNEYNVPNDKLGSRLEKVVTRFRTRVRNNNSNNSQSLPRTVQDTFPYNNVSQANMYDTPSATPSPPPPVMNRGRARNKRSPKISRKRSSLFTTLSKEMTRSGQNEHSATDLYEKMSRAGITGRAAMGAQAIAGETHLNDHDVRLLRKLNIAREDQEKLKNQTTQ